MNKTHWGFKLHQMCKEELDYKEESRPMPDGVKVVPTTARTLKKVLHAFFHGKSDPRWTRKFTSKVYHPDRKYPDLAKRSRRFLEMLRTIDGIIAQRLCAFPHEFWTYEKYDLIVLKLIYELISDEFLDGRLTDYGQVIQTRFSSLKKIRGTFKRYAGRKTNDISKDPLFKREQWLRSLFIPLYKEYEKEEDPEIKVYLNGVLCQKRGAGKPSPLDKLQSKKKFLKTVTTPDLIKPFQVKMVGIVMQELIAQLPDHIFTGLSTKSGVSVTTSACYEYSSREFGTLQAIQDLCAERAVGVKAIERCLETGKIISYFCKEKTEGTYIFFRSLEEVLSMKPEDRSKATVVLVDEPGKSRAVTKAVACLKIVLEFVSKICAIPLEKGFSSSNSGMTASNHSWNFFKGFDQSPLKDLIFRIKKSEKEQYEGYCEITSTYHSVFMVSTDYETATDYLSHSIAKVIAYPWMLKCGIPKILRNLVCEVAFKPRKLYFKGDFLMGTLEDESEQLRSINTCRGVLMGDPLTKVILHFCNIVARRLSHRVFDETFLTKVFGTAKAHEYFKRKLVHKAGVKLG
jgi:hypothetical protein